MKIIKTFITNKDLGQPNKTEHPKYWGKCHHSLFQVILQSNKNYNKLKNTYINQCNTIEDTTLSSYIQIHLIFDKGAEYILGEINGDDGITRYLHRKE